jgi:hypothetical protein
LQDAINDILRRGIAGDKVSTGKDQPRRILAIGLVRLLVSVWIPPTPS